MENDKLHVGIILDGNRRYAKKVMLEPWKGHELGAKKVEDLMDYAKELGVKELTLYALSTENLKRPDEEVKQLLRLMKEEFQKLERERIHRDKVKIRFIGNLSLIPADLRKLCKNLEKETQDYSNYIVNFAIAYGGREEIIQAIKKIAKNKIKPEKINEKIIKENLYLQDEPDLIIRTGGAMRTSNFLSWQSVYSEWFFIDKLWPEFAKEDLAKIIEEFHNRKRNFGK